MPERTRPTMLICTNCKLVAPTPKEGDHRPLWREGWRWIGSWGLFSCPGCPPVVLVDENGNHRLPDRLRQKNAKGSDIEGTASPSEPHPNPGA